MKVKAVIIRVSKRNIEPTPGKSNLLLIAKANAMAPLTPLNHKKNCFLKSIIVYLSLDKLAKKLQIIIFKALPIKQKIIIANAKENVKSLFLKIILT
jgi:hypothetical protein